MVVKLPNLNVLDIDLSLYINPILFFWFKCWQNPDSQKLGGVMQNSLLLGLRK